MTFALKPDTAMKTETNAAVRRGDSSTDRVLGLLDLFTVETPIWTADMLMDNQGLGRATVYRYLKALTDAGFLAPIGGGGYALGPRFIEMDRQIRMADPLLQIGPCLMQSLRKKVAGAQLLCRYYGLRVLTIHEERTDERILTSFQRGRPFPLFLGAPSRIILANLPQPQLQKLFLYHADEIRSAGLGSTWIEFRDQMKAVRKTGYAVASDIDKTLVGVAAPIFLAPDAVTASLCLVRLKEECTEDDIAFLGEVAIKAGQKLSEGLQQLTEARSTAQNSADGQERNRKTASPRLKTRAIA